MLAALWYTDAGIPLTAWPGARLSRLVLSLGQLLAVAPPSVIQKGQWAKCPPFLFYFIF